MYFFIIRNFSIFLFFLFLNNIFLSNSYKLEASNSKSNIKEEIYSKEVNHSKTYTNNKSEYILGPGDILFVKFDGIKLFSNDYPIDLDGYLNLPEINDLYASGKTIKELELYLNKEYEEFIFNPDIEIKISRYKPINVIIKGEVNVPGLYTFDGSDYKNESPNTNEFQEQRKIFQLFKLSKGITGNADISNIKIIRKNSISNGGGKIQSSINILDILEKGDQEQNITLHDGDLIIVPKSNKTILKQINLANKSNLTPDQMKVYINGNVSKTGALKVPQGATLNEALAQAGGTLPLTGRIEFLRFKENGDAEKRSLKYSLNAKKNSKRNPILIDGDIIQVRQNLVGKSTSLLKEVGTPVINAAAIYSIFD